jgi:hypothetical protein
MMPPPAPSPRLDALVRFVRKVADDRTEGTERRAEKWIVQRWEALRLLAEIGDRPDETRVPR